MAVVASGSIAPDLIAASIATVMTHPIKIVVLDNDEPCDCYNSSFANTLDKIKKAQFSCSPLTRNSNSVAGTALRASGFDVGPLPVSAPGFDTNLGPK
jgi:hypothetical protein